MTGVILGGGEGTRLYPATRAYNKHTAVVYDRPMVHYPIETLKALGCDEVIVVSGPKGCGDLFKVLRNGQDLGVEIHYAVQEHEAGGTAEALGAVEGMVEGTFPVLCGDVYFDPAPEIVDQPTLYYHEFEGAENHSVWNPETNEIIEKPLRDIGKRAIIAYWFDERVFDVIRKLEPSRRGELEMVDVYKWYLENGIQMKEYKGLFVDMGTPDGLLKVANRTKEKADE